MDHQSISYRNQHEPAFTHNVVRSCVMYSQHVQYKEELGFFEVKTVKQDRSLI